MENGFQRKTDTLPTCMNCGSVLYGGFCSHCGQQSTEEITFQGLVADFRRQVIELDNPWIRTAIDLTRRPGKMIRGYLRGRRLPYVGPLAYALVAVTLLVAVTGVMALDLSSPHTPWGAQKHADPSFPTFVFACYSMLWISGGVAWFQQALFRQERYSVTQTWVFDLFILGHLALLQTVFAGLGAFASSVGLLALLAALVLVLASALSSFYRRSVWLAMPAALILGTLHVAGVFTSAALFRRLFF